MAPFSLAFVRKIWRFDTLAGSPEKIGLPGFHLSTTNLSHPQYFLPMDTLSDKTLLAHTSSIVLDRLGDGFLFGLPWPEQVVAIVYSAQGLIDHGGFRHFFANNWPDTPPYSVFADAYRDIGAVEAAECIEAATSLFPFSDPHRDRDGRRAILKESCADKSSTLVRLGDRVASRSHSILTLLAAYIRRHRDEIFHTTS